LGKKARWESFRARPPVVHAGRYGRGKSNECQPPSQVIGTHNSRPVRRNGEGGSMYRTPEGKTPEKVKEYAFHGSKNCVGGLESRSDQQQK